MTRTEIIAQLDEELGRLARARDFLAAALTKSRFVSTSKAKLPIPRKNSNQAPVAAAPAAGVPQSVPTVAAPPVLPNPEPQVQRVPPKRRLERRQLQAAGMGKSAAALSGPVPVGPVAVSAHEARKQQERSTQAAPAPVEAEIPSDLSSERSLGSLIQAFERRAALSRLEIP
jgi:hypothetical protein